MISEDKNIRQLTWFEKFKNVGYNVKYKAYSYLQQVDKYYIIKNAETIYMLGRTYNSTIANLADVNKAVYVKFCNTPWMTYRAIFPELNGKNGEDYIADTGWGCMIRVGQMYMAQTLKLFLQLEQKNQIKEILCYFDDYDHSQMFSIQQIVKYAYIEYSIEPGKWYNPSQISYILTDLFKKEKKKTEKFNHLEFLVLNNSTLFIDQILLKMIKKKQLCKCKKSTMVCYKCYQGQNSLSLILLTRIGLQSPEKKYLKVLNRLIQSRFFQGMIGGKPDKALYFLGRKQDHYIYLDPHLVQTGINKENLDKNIESYFCSSLRMCKNNSIDPSIGIGFYLRELKDVDQFYDFMLRIKTEYLEDFFIFLSETTPQYMKNQVDYSSKPKSEDFQCADSNEMIDDPQ